MHRCAASASTGAPRRLVLTALAVACASAALPVQSQALMRRFPRNALRGEIAFGAFPEILLNGRAASLAPGARVKDLGNAIPMPGALAGNKYVVNFTVNSMGLVQDVWILRPDEIRMQPWPRTPVEAQTWAFNEGEQTWTKP
ncbi:MAG TPA: hypothetical protein VFY73_20165 [Ideonella sp.]|uniref:hypothetical protein n=1 Tax=Ideonella sp. TaxID=1929293 RepID=UPI002E305F49|nr:hypothetical protein [Ideonella sp.]HEX5686350.1 hypothetical protein [Ideonella sp.]